MRRHILEISLLVALVAVGFWYFRLQPRLTMLSVCPGWNRAQVEEKLGQPDFQTGEVADYRTEQGVFSFYYVGDQVSYCFGPVLEINGDPVPAKELAEAMGTPDTSGKIQKWFAQGVTVMDDTVYLRPREEFALSK